MAAPKEVELKLEVPPASRRGLGKIPLLPVLERSTETEISVYFDTDKQTLRNNGLMLRVRRIGKRHVQTIKATEESDLFRRGEWENEVATQTPDLRLARGTALKPLLTHKVCRQLKPIFETRVRRKPYRLSDDGHTVKMTLDKVGLMPASALNLCARANSTVAAGTRCAFKAKSSATHRSSSPAPFRARRHRGGGRCLCRDSKALQDRLGDLNDIVVHDALITAHAGLNRGARGDTRTARVPSRRGC
jgi:hypothetical protein